MIGNISHHLSSVKYIIAAGVSQPLTAVSPRDTIKRVQEAIGVVNDGFFGKRSREKFNEILDAAGQPGI